MKSKLLIAIAAMIAMSANAEIKREDYPSYKAYLEAVSAYNAGVSAELRENQKPKRERDSTGRKAAASIKPGDEYKSVINHSKASADANYDRGREKYLIRQGSTRSEKFSVHESARPKTQSSVIMDSNTASRKTASVRSQNGSGSITYGGSFRRSASSAGQGMSRVEREEAIRRAEERYAKALESGRIAPRESLAGDDYKAERDAYLAKKR